MSILLQGFEIFRSTFFFTPPLIFKAITVSFLMKPKTKSAKAHPENVNEVKAQFDSISVHRYDDSIDPNLLRLISTSLVPVYYMMLNTVATVILCQIPRDVA